MIPHRCLRCLKVLLQFVASIASMLVQTLLELRSEFITVVYLGILFDGY